MPIKDVARAMLIAGLLTMPATAREDLAGASDHPSIPRIAGTTIIGYDHSSFGEGQFHSSTEDRSLNLEFVEGPITRIVYLGPDSLSPLGAVRNYQAAFAEVGEVEEIFFCKDRDCFRNLGGAFIWASDRRIPIDVGVPHYLYHQPKYYRDQVYWYARVNGDDKSYTVSVYAATRADEDDFMDRRGFDAGQVLVHLDVVDGEAFEPTLEVVAADDITQAIGEAGHIALYGIYFDTGSDALQPGSRPTLEEIAKAMQADAELSIYVVGHTDNVGTVADNQDLSERRARSVVASLTEEHGIDASRLVALGAGLAAPVASNDTEDGRALNRRVELVKR